MRLASAVVMVRPAAFGYNPEAAASNVFAREPTSGIAGAALREFDAAVEGLRGAGVTVVVVEDSPLPVKPDAVFPNNWVSFHPGGTAVVYPMAVASRRPERRQTLLDAVYPLHRTREVIDLTPLESTGGFLEGTGSLILDHEARTAWAALSPRTTLRGLATFADRTGYRVLVFEAALDGVPVYHTNVVMALGPEVAVLGLPAVRPGAACDALLASLGGRSLVVLEADQLREYAGNLLFLETPTGPAAVLSRRANAALTRTQRAAIGPRIVLDIEVIERVGGGSARCMLGEVFT